MDDEFVIRGYNKQRGCPVAVRKTSEMLSTNEQ